MKRILFGLIFAFAVSSLGFAAPASAPVAKVKVEKVAHYFDEYPTYGTPEWKAYSEADKLAKADKDGTVAGYLKAALDTPFAWAASWHYFNAGKGTYKDDPEKAEGYLKLAEDTMKDAKLNVPTAGPNTPENLVKAIESIRKAMKVEAVEQE